MPRGSAPEWKRRKEPILDHYIQALLDRANNQTDEHGCYGTLVYAGCQDFSSADEIRKALYRSACHMKVSLSYKIKKADDGTWNVEFSCYPKAVGKAHVVNHYGEDRSKWAYDPRKKNEK